MPGIIAAISPKASALIDQHQSGALVTDYPATAAAYVEYAEAARLMDGADYISQNSAERTGRAYAATLTKDAEQIRAALRDVLHFVAPRFIASNETMTTAELIAAAIAHVQHPDLAVSLDRLKAYPAELTRRPDGSFTVRAAVKL